ncbi:MULTISPECIES: helix-turn-helix domain-containing protein [Arthrobacter]|uniref:DNA-binding protein n=1 Tax=Arthrobacter terricola TaxID=2547396 RepID=A0A4V2ZTV6_9MICC|nr:MULTISPECIES: helix-turn-helix domain-containing protein [Arthrobacter]MBT8160550.1 helix-turn-helix domain-containing protein [Arthrobacter sp. GN70]TDF98534.1 DNA-binding protein [Arthrobacter terricola]
MGAAGIPASRFMTIAEVAEALRVSKMTVYRLVNSHAIQAVRFGRSYRVPESAVEDYIEHATVDPEHHHDDGSGQ